MRSVRDYHRICWNSARLCCTGSVALSICQARGLHVKVEPDVTKNGYIILLRNISDALVFEVCVKKPAP